MRGSRPLLLFVIGIGNPLRGDDGGGITFARALGEAFSRRGVLFYLQVTQQLLPELAEAIEIAAAAAEDQRTPPAWSCSPSGQASSLVV